MMASELYTEDMALWYWEPPPILRFVCIGLRAYDRGHNEYGTIYDRSLGARQYDQCRVDGLIMRLIVVDQDGHWADVTQRCDGIDDGVEVAVRSNVDLRTAVVSVNVVMGWDGEEFWK